MVKKKQVGSSAKLFFFFVNGIFNRQNMKTNRSITKFSIFKTKNILRSGQIVQVGRVSLNKQFFFFGL